ncbi:MAG: tetratricopeptide repeat protein [candidate division WOR-3 bacterium]|jgi:tetratricopeptide (TPR) repeat protein
MIMLIFLNQISKADTAKMWFSVARDYFQKQQFEKAIENYKRALSYDEKFLPAYLDMALSFVALKQPDSALKIYEKVVQLFPDRPEGYQGLGYIYGYIKNDYNLSIENYKKALSLDPNNEVIIKLLLGVYEKSGNYQDAESLYNNLLSKYPDDVKILKAYTQILLKQNKLKEASENIEKLYSKDSTSKEIWEMGYVVNSKLINEDIKTYKPRYLKYLEKLYKSEPNNAEYLNALVDEAINNRNYNKAIEYLETYLKTNENSSVYLKLGTIYFEYLKNYSKAEELFNKAVSLGQKEGLNSVVAFAYASLGDIYMDRAQGLFNNEKYNDAIRLYDVAISYYNRALDISSGNLKKYVSEQVDRAKKLRQTAWRRANNIE